MGCTLSTQNEKCTYVLEVAHLEILSALFSPALSLPQKLPSEMAVSESVQGLSSAPVQEHRLGQIRCRSPTNISLSSSEVRVHS